MYFQSDYNRLYGVTHPLTRYGKKINTSARRMLWSQQSAKPPKEEYAKRSLFCQRLEEWNRNNG